MYERELEAMFAYHVKSGHHPSFFVSEELPFYFRHYAGVDIMEKPGVVADYRVLL